MKKIFLVVLLILCIKVNAQTVRGFGGMSAYLQWDFEKSFYGGFNAGTEFKVNSYLMPELEFSYLFGFLEDQSRYNEQLVHTSSYTRSVSSINFSFCPKIVIGNKNDGTGYLVILPKYIFSQIEAKGNFIGTNENNVIVESRDYDKSSQHSFGFGVGYNLLTSNDDSSSLCLSICYSGVNFGKAINNLQHSSGYEINAKGVLGAGLNYYFGFKKKQKPKPIKTPNPLQ
jgi:hypothetical protein